MSHKPARSPSYEEGNTAPRSGPAWTLQQPHDEQEDSILAKVDMERGFPPPRAVIRGRGMRGVTLEVPHDKRFLPQLALFVEWLADVMTRAPEDGARSATQAYVIAREMQLVLLKGKTHTVTCSPEGIRAFATEMETFLPKDPAQYTPRQALMAQLLETIAEHINLRRRSERRRRR